MSQPLTFLYPWALILLLILPLWWLVPPARHLAPRARTTIRLLRSLITLALVLALAEPLLRLPPGRTTTIFLLDASGSIDAAQRAAAETYTAAALAALPADDAAGLVLFGADALVERPPGPERTLGAPTLRPDASATDIGAALRLAAALIPESDHGRIVLLSDGGETRGDLRTAARAAQLRDLPVDVVIAADPVRDARLLGIDLPSAARDAQRLPLRVRLLAPDGGTLRVLVGTDIELARVAVAASAGVQELLIDLPPSPAGFTRIRAQLDAPGDAALRNNRAEAFTLVSGPPRALIIEGSTGESAALTAALTAAGFGTDVRAPAAAPTGLGEYAGFDLTLLVDVPQSALDARAQQAIQRSVRDLGRGLVMVGGPRSFGAGGWRGTPVEAALPVTMDIPTTLRRPPVSVVVIIDISGSMAADVGGRTRLSLAVEGAQRLADLLRDEDELTVIPFDDAPRGTVGPLPGSRRAEAIQQLAGVSVGGGGIDYRPALDEAARILANTDRTVKHIITLTDGDDTVGQEGAIELITRLRGDGVTLTAVSIGDGQHVPFIASAAEAGGGRFFFADSARNLPQILVDETRAVVENPIVEGAFTPLVHGSHSTTQNLAFAPLGGYVITTARPTAQIQLSAPGDAPLLATWQYGLGRAAAFTSDAGAKWTTAWTRSSDFARFATQLADWVRPARGDDRLAVSAQASDGGTAISAQASDAGGRPASGLVIEATVFMPQGERVVPLREVQPGVYRAEIADIPAGAYPAVLAARDASGQPYGQIIAGIVVPPEAEFGAPGDAGLLEDAARITGGLVNPPAPGLSPGRGGRGAPQPLAMALLLLALILLPCDVVLRRLARRAGRVGASARRADGARAAPADVGPKQRFDPTDPAPRPDDARRAALREQQEQARRRARGAGGDGDA